MHRELLKLIKSYYINDSIEQLKFWKFNVSYVIISQICRLLIAKLKLAATELNLSDYYKNFLHVN